MTKEPRYFNPLSPCGERLYKSPPNPLGCKISTHSPRVGRDCYEAEKYADYDISTHSPRVGRDQCEYSIAFAR